MKYDKLIKELYNELDLKKKHTLEKMLKLQKAIAVIEVYKLDSDFIDKRIDCAMEYLEDMISELFEDGIED